MSRVINAITLFAAMLIVDVVGAHEFKIKDFEFIHS